MLTEIRSRFWPNKVVAALPATGESTFLTAVLAGKRPLKNEPTLYICENYACQQPASGKEAIAAECEKLASAAK